MIGETLRNAALRCPGATALSEGGRSWTYAELNADVNRAAHGLLRMGIGPGDRAMVCSRNRAEVVLAYLALQKLGACYAPVNPRLSEAELRHCLALIEPRALIFEGRALGSSAPMGGPDPDARQVVIDDEGEPVPDWATPFGALWEGSPPSEPPGRPADTDLSLLFFTSGTTGRPKGVPRTHRNEVAATLLNLIALGWRPGERLLGVMPLYHTMGVRTLLSSIFLGGHFALQGQWEPGAALELIERHRLTSLFLVPTMFHDLLRDDGFEERRVAGLRSLGYAGMVMNRALIGEVVERLRPERLVNLYGSSEIYCFSVCHDVARKPGSAGTPPFQQRIRVIRADPMGGADPDEEVPAGEQGEIICSASSDDAFAGYWRNPEATERALRRGWYLTGDLGFRDGEGDLFVLGRVDDAIITGGENVHPLEVENVLARCPAVADVAVAGLADERLGQVVAAFIVRSDPTLDEARVRDFLRASGQLASFKQPRQVHFVEAIPRSPVGKVLRRLLRERWSADELRG